MNDGTSFPGPGEYVIESDFTAKDHSVSVLSLTLITRVPIRAVLRFFIFFPFRSISVPTRNHDLKFLRMRITITSERKLTKKIPTLK